MNDIYVTLHFGPAEFKYTFLFIVYLCVGWLTIIFHAREKFDQPTYDTGNADVDSIMVPRLFLSQHLYLRGFMIYLAGMTGIFFALSLAGPALVMGMLAVFENPDAVSMNASAAVDTVVPSQWPLVLALAIVGLAPKIGGLRMPELRLRRFSHRIALIPAYARYLAFRMRQSPFDISASGRCAYPPPIRYRPSQQSTDPLDRTWLKTLVLTGYVKAGAEGTFLSDSAGSVDQGAKSALQTETRILCSALRDVDGRLAATASPEERDALDAELQELLSRVYLLVACTILAARIRDIDGELRAIGFQLTVANAPTLLPVAMALSLLFLALVVGNETLLAIGGRWGAAVAPPSFSLNCLSTSYTAMTYGVSLLAAIGVYRSLDTEGGWRQDTRENPINSYFLVTLAGYGAAWLLLNLLLFPILAAQGLDKLFAFSTFRSLSPGAGALFLSLWLHRKETSGREFVRYATTTSVVLALVAGFGSLLLLREAEDPYPVLQVFYDAFQGLLSGLAVACLAELSRSYRTSVMMPVTERAALLEKVRRFSV
jgi:hypothetical protein